MPVINFQLLEDILICLSSLCRSYHALCAQANTKAKQKHSIATEYTLRMLGLLQAAETVVGNQM